MDVETLIWTLVLFGGSVLAMVWLSYIAWRKEKEGPDGAEGGEGPDGTERNTE